MRRALLAALAVLALLAAAWTGWWYYAAGKIRAEVAAWADARRAEGYTIVWDGFVVGGYPLDFRVRTERLVVSRGAPQTPWEARLPELVAETRAWDLRRWRYEGPAGLKGRMAPTDVRPEVLIAAAGIDGTVTPSSEATEVTLAAREVSVEGEARVRSARVTGRLLLPSQRAPTHRDLAGRATLRLEQLLLPVAVPKLGERIESAEATLALKGAVPPGPLRQSLAAWRDAGGTVEVENLRLVWSGLDASAEGTLALDAGLQPVGAGTARVAGWAEILDALVAAGQMRQGDAVLARLGLAVMAKPGPGGRSRLEAPVTIQNGILTIAQFRVARLPRFTWE